MNENAVNERVASINSPVRSTLQKNSESDKNSMIKLNSMTAVQLNQHQIQIE
jgi:hypothetical protein